MNINDFKGTLYDILGYFAPGAFLLIVSILTYLRIQNPNGILFIFKSIVDLVSGFEIFILIIAAYIVGHIISSIGAFIIESVLIKNIKSLNNHLSIKSLFDDEHYSIFYDKYKNEFKAKYNDKNFRKVICYVQSNQSQIYGTALIFLSFYGMARSFACVFLVLSILEIALLYFKAKGSLLLLIAFVFLFIVFIYEYIRFMKYYRDTIVSGFLVND